jgi:hypothetical protein
MHKNTHRRPYVSSMLHWAAAYPHFTSAKLLHASSWDDIRDSNELGEWTIRQRPVAVSLLHDALKARAEQDIQIIICTIQLLLGFEVCCAYIACIFYSQMFFYFPSLSDNPSLCVDFGVALASYWER